MTEPNFEKEDFGELLKESFAQFDLKEGTVVKGTVVGVEKDVVIVDVGLKVEGRVPIKEFGIKPSENELKLGDEVEVYLERVENAFGEAVLSREKARREESWIELEKSFEKNEKVNGHIFSYVKGGYTVDLNGAVAFLPRSQVDVRPIRDIGSLMDTEQTFQILKMDKRRGNIVVSRRNALEESLATERTELVQNLKEGQTHEGVVKNIVDFGAFVDLGGIDGLLHVTDISWKRITHPGEVLNIGDTVQVQIIRINQDTHRISLGMKQLVADPWENIETRYPIGGKHLGRITNITDYGAFVEIETGIEGLIHVSEMSWTKKNVPPGKIVSTSQQVEVVVLEIDPPKRRISLGLKQAMPNPWEEFKERYPAGSRVEGEIKNKTEFGLFIGLENEIDGLVHLTDLDWNLPGEQVIEGYSKGQKVTTAVLDVDIVKERISLGIKQLTGDPFETGAGGDLRRGSVVTCEVKEIKETGLDVKIVGTELVAFIRRVELSKDRDEQRTDRFGVGDKFDARITQFDKKARKINASVKALEVAEEKEAIAQFGSTDSGASLGEILGPALKTKDEPESTEEETKTKEKTTAAAKAKEKPAEKKSNAQKDESESSDTKTEKDESKPTDSKTKNEEAEPADSVSTKTDEGSETKAAESDTETHEAKTDTENSVDAKEAESAENESDSTAEENKEETKQ